MLALTQHGRSCVISEHDLLHLRALPRTVPQLCRLLGKKGARAYIIKFRKQVKVVNGVKC
jgi:hypothetical protein